MAESVFKFSCPTCGQHISAPLERAGSAAACPTCGAAFTVPAAPPAPPAPTETTSAKAQTLAAQIRALGYVFTIPAEIENEDLEARLQDFLMYQDRAFEDTFMSLEEDDRIIFLKRPSHEKLRVIGNELLKVIFNEDFEDYGDVEKIILRIAPEIRA